MDCSSEGDDDEYADIDWGGVAEAVAVSSQAMEDEEEAAFAEVAELAARRTAATEDAAVAAAAEAVAGTTAGVAGGPPTSSFGEAEGFSEKAAGSERLAPATLDLAELQRRRELRRSAVERHQVLAICYVSRLRMLSGICDDALVQALALSHAGLPSPSSSSTSAPPPVEGLSRRCELLGVLSGARRPTEEDVALSRVARYRAEGRLARLAMSLPLPAASACLALVRVGEARLPDPEVWAEMFDRPSGSWTAERRPTAGAASGGRGGGRSVAATLWILACGEGGALRDVTRRYAPRWSAVCAARGSLARHWDAVVARHSEGAWTEEDALAPAAVAASLELARADLLDEACLARRAKNEPIPTSKAAFKRHASYVLDSQLRAQDMLHPPDSKPVGLFRGQEKVWRRSHVVELRTATQWRRERRCVREGERPLKTLRGGKVFAAQLFGEWQTEAAPEVPFPVEFYQDGGAAAIPGTNNFGNIELLDAIAVDRLPSNLVYLPDNAARSAAARLSVAFAPAVVGFVREGGLPKPKLGGAVVWARDAEEVARAMAEEKERLAIEEEKKRQERFKSAWRMLVKNVLVDMYVEDRYRGDVSGVGGAAREAPGLASAPPAVLLADVL